MVLRVRWSDVGIIGGAVTVYWIPDETDFDWRDGYNHVTRALGHHLTIDRNVHLPRTSEETASWAAAAAAFVDEAAAAGHELDHYRQLVRRWRRWPPLVCRRAQARYDRAEEQYLHRVGAAAAVYQPVHDLIELRLEQERGARQEKQRRAADEQQRAHRTALARFLAWRWRQELANRPLNGGPTLRQRAADGDDPPVLPPQTAAAVGDVGAWWARLRAAADNERALADAVREVFDAVTATAQALERRGTPGMTAVAGSGVVLNGWWVDFSWPALPDPAVMGTPRGVPVGHLGAGEWDCPWFLPDRVFLARSWSGDYQLAELGTERFYDHWTREKWSTSDIEEFAAELMPTQWWYEGPGLWRTGNLLSIPFTEYAEPGAYARCVHAVASHAAAAFRALVPAADATGG